jgi:hypothetical protein
MRIAPVFVTAVVSTLALAACEKKAPVAAVPSVIALESDPILLSRVLGECNAVPASAGNPECINARAAVDRRSAAEQAERATRAESGFEMAREARRRADEAAKQSQEALQKRVSPYELPVEGTDDKPAISRP